VSVNARAWLGVVLMTVFMSVVLFGAAGTIDYWQAWVYLGVYLGASALITADLMKRSPALLERRLRGGPQAEKEPTQKVIMLLTSIGFLALLVVPALDVRFRWSSVPVPVVVLGDVLIVIGYIIIHRVFRANPFASASIELASEQRVISTGPYAIVRHPMYVGGSLYLLGMSPALGSWWGLLALVGVLPALVWRLLDEERFLAKNLPGYADYCAKVRARLIPGIF
jgi:protein-S-isoprenylcysteine O-methyltransferase Ste14